MFIVIMCKPNYHQTQYLNTVLDICNFLSGCHGSANLWKLEGTSVSATEKPIIYNKLKHNIEK